MLKIINPAISFDFVNEILEDSYCKGFERPAKEPEMMLKRLLSHLEKRACSRRQL